MSAEPFAAGLVAGVVAGLALTLPFGALGAMLVDTAMRSSRRVAMSAAAGVAMTDFCFALLSAMSGAVVTSVLAPWARHVQLASAVLVLAMGLHALRSARAVSLGTRDAVLAGVVVTDAAAPTAGGGYTDIAAYTEKRAARRVLLRFVAITATNPLTTLTLTAVSAGLATNGIPVCLGFAFGCGAVSVAWHSMLAIAGQALGARLGPASRRAAAHLGAALTIAMAIGMALSA